jgi:hypothetical protein
MAGTVHQQSEPHLTFRSRSVRIAGAVDLGIGIALVLAGTGYALVGGRSAAVPVGIALGVLGVILGVTGLGRITARMEITRSHVVWTWSFSRSQLPFDDLDDAALVEKGAPASGGAWAGFLGGGITWVVAWWLFDVARAFVSSEPTLGPLELVAIRHYGGPVSIKPIGAWSTHDSHSQARQALGHLQAAIHASSHRAPVVPDILRTDQWEHRPDH